MNVTITGVKGYEYQYKVTAFISLSTGVETNSEIYVEKIGSEDATLILKSGSLTKKIEVQIKREKNNIDIKKITAWLCHFQEGSADNNLLFRLASSADDLVLFVTQSRCSDDTVRFKRNLPEINLHDDLKISKEWNDKFIYSLNDNEYVKVTSNLGKLRNNFCKSQGEHFKESKKTQQTLQRAIVWEEVSDEQIDNRILTLLNKKYKIPQSQTEDAYLSILEKVRYGRDNSAEIVPLIREVLNERMAGRPLVAPTYKVRLEESKLLQILKKSNLLLLTGISLCGKSETAKKIASTFFDEGFNYGIFTDINELRHFFSLSPSEDKIAVLEDPWGHLQRENESLNIWHKVEQIVANLASNHKLIITSRIEIIQDIYPLKSLSNCNIKGHNWHDLTNNDKKNLMEFWREIAIKNSIPQKIIELLEKNIISEKIENLLQIGQLEYIANTEIEDLENKNTNELEHLARQNSLDIAESLRSKQADTAEVLSILSLCSSTIHGVTLDDLSYILSNDEKDYSIIEKDFWISPESKADISFPKYDKTDSLEILEKHLQYLEHRRFITIEAEKIFFPHPNFYEAGRHLFFKQSSIEQKRFLKYCRKVLSCLNPETTYLCTRQFNFLLTNIDPKYKKEIFQLAFLGTNSIFPATEDSCMVFLIGNISSLSEEEKKKIIHSLDSADTSSHHIFWHKNETPFINKKGNTFRERFFKLDDAELKEIETKFKAGFQIRSFDAWQYIISLRNSQQREFDKQIVKYLLQYREVFIRKQISLLFFLGSLNKDDTKLIEEIFQDEHPSVIFNALRGCFLQWNSFSEEMRSFLFPLMKETLEQQPVAIRANQLMTTFAKEHQSESINWSSLKDNEKTELWNIWGQLYPIFTKQLPANVFLNTGRFGMTMDEALKHLTPENGIRVLSAWYERIDFKMSSGHFLDEYEMAIADNLLNFTGNNYEIRREVFTKLVDYPDTNFILSSLKWIVEYWNDMYISEKKKILELIKSNREDVRWVKAVLLNTYSNPPAEIQHLIIGDSDLFSKSEEEVVRSFPQDLLADCLNVYCGHPQPLWWLAVHHKNKNFWGRIIRYILLNEIQPHFNICLRELLSDGVNGFSAHWQDGIEIWKQVCSKTENKPELANRLIYETATCTCNIDTANELWSVLIESYSKRGEIDTISQIVADNIEVIQQTGHIEDVLEIFNKDFLFDNVFPRLQPDRMVITTLDILQKTPSNSDQISTLLETEISKLETFRFFVTHKYIERVSTEISFSDSLREKLLSIPHNYDVTGEKRLEVLKTKEEYTLENWIERTCNRN